MEGSSIYNDAADLHTALLQEYQAITGAPTEQNEKQGELEKLLTDTTNELCEAMDETGLNLAYHFMELPDGALYPQYYMVIQRPMCFNNILRKIRRHEYVDANSWGLDVGLIFANAATFNEDNSPIVVQAKALQLLFNSLVEKFPPEFAVEKLPSPAPHPAPKSNVIKIKVGRPKKGSEVARPATPPVPKPRHSSSTDPPAVAGTPEVTIIKLEEATKVATPPPASTAALPQPSATPAPVVIKQQAPPQTPISQMPPSTPQPNPFKPTPSSAAVSLSRLPYPTQTRPYPYPQLPPQIPPGPTFQSSFILGPPMPLPEGMMKNPITHVGLRTIPIGRTIWLDARDGVSSWSIRLAGGKREQGICIDRIEIEADDDVRSEDVKEGPEVQAPRKRGRPPTRSIAAQQAMMNGNGYVKRVAAIEYLRALVVKLNGKTLAPVDETIADPSMRQWTVNLNQGASVLDIGAWRIYVDRD
ncbi:Methionine aminopeptidase 2 [Serendipita sp. 397]|nr:Methionine aminopeptidase 2 [Serendipita sp. 397]